MGAVWVVECFAVWELIFAVCRLVTGSFDASPSGTNLKSILCHALFYLIIRTALPCQRCHKRYFPDCYVAGIPLLVNRGVAGAKLICYI